MVIRYLYIVQLIEVPLTASLDVLKACYDACKQFIDIPVMHNPTA